MRLLIALPAYNEAAKIREVLKKIPAHFSGISEILTVVVNDGSSDATAEEAILGGVGVVSQIPQKGLAGTYNTILQTALAEKVDFLIHFDADGQYDPGEILLILEPLLHKEADMVIGDRQVKKLRFMASSKRIGNLTGSFLLKNLLRLGKREAFGGGDGFDASSGFRGLNRGAVETLLGAGGMQSKTTYTHESLIIAAFSGLKIKFVPITFLARAEGDSSRLIKSVAGHIFKCFTAIFATWWGFMLRRRKVRLNQDNTHHHSSF